LFIQHKFAQLNRFRYDEIDYWK